VPECKNYFPRFFIGAYFAQCPRINIPYVREILWNPVAITPCRPQMMPALINTASSSHTRNQPMAEACLPGALMLLSPMSPPAIVTSLLPSGGLQTPMAYDHTIRTSAATEPEFYITISLSFYTRLQVELSEAKLELDASRRLLEAHSAEQRIAAAQQKLEAAQRDVAALQAKLDAIHQAEIERPFKCTFLPCTGAYTTNKGLIRHVVQCHTG